MRRPAAALAALALALAGCGDGSADEAADRIGDAAEKAEGETRERLKELEREARKGDDVVEDAMRRIRESDMPADVKKELEEAKRLLDEQAGGG